jgi:hypothetical protein
MCATDAFGNFLNMSYCIAYNSTMCYKDSGEACSDLKCKKPANFNKSLAFVC